MNNAHMSLLNSRSPENNAEKKGRGPTSVSHTREKKMTMMMNHGLTSLQRNGVIIKLIIDDVKVSLAMVIPQRPHHNSAD